MTCLLFEITLMLLLLFLIEYASWFERVFQPVELRSKKRLVVLQGRHS